MQRNDYGLDVNRELYLSASSPSKVMTAESARVIAGAEKNSPTITSSNRRKKVFWISWNSNFSLVHNVEFKENHGRRTWCNKVKLVRFVWFYTESNLLFIMRYCQFFLDTISKQWENTSRIFRFRKKKSFWQLLQVKVLKHPKFCRERYNY